MTAINGQFDTVYKEANAVKALRFHCSRQWSVGGYLLVGAIFTIVLFFLFEGSPPYTSISAAAFTATASLLIAACVVGLMILINRKGGHGQVRSWMSQYNLEGAVCGFQYDQEKLKITDRMFGGEMAWNEAHGWVENDDLLMIYRSPVFYYYVPKADVPAQDVENLISVMQAAQVPKL